MSRFTGAPRTPFTMGLLALMWFAFGGQVCWAGEIEVGLQGVPVVGSTPGGTVWFSGFSGEGAWLFGGYGEGRWSSSFSLAGGGALVGIRPVSMVTVLAKVGLGAGFLGGEAGATRQCGVEIALGGPVMAVTGTWERVWNLAELPSLPPAGRESWGLGVRFRFEVDGRSEL